MIRAISRQERPRGRLSATLTASSTFFGLPSRFSLHARSVAFGIQALAFLNVLSYPRSVIDTTTLQDVSDIKIAGTTPEQMSIENAGSRLYVDITDKNQVGVVDRQKRTLLGTWPITKGNKCISNSADEDNHRLFVGCRNSDMSGVIVVIDTQTGKETGLTLPIGGWVDNMFFDPASKRLYATCGTGHVYVYQQRDADHYDLLGKAETAVMGKTGLLVPELNRFFVSIPHIGGTQAKVLVFQIN